MPERNNYNIYRMRVPMSTNWHVQTSNQAGDLRHHSRSNEYPVTSCRYMDCIMFQVDPLPFPPVSPLCTWVLVCACSSVPVWDAGMRDPALEGRSVITHLSGALSSSVRNEQRSVEHMFISSPLPHGIALVSPLWSAKRIW